MGAHQARGLAPGVGERCATESFRSTVVVAVSRVDGLKRLADGSERLVDRPNRLVGGKGADRV